MRAGAAALLLALASGCGGTEVIVRRETSAPTAPAWLSRVPTTTAAVAVVGRGEGTSLDEARIAARRDAAVQAAQAAGTWLRYEHEVQGSSRDNGDHARERLSAFVQAQVPGLQAHAEHWTKTTELAGRWSRDRWEVAFLYWIDHAVLRGATEASRALIGEARESAADAVARLDHAVANEQWASAEVLATRLEEWRGAGLLDADLLARADAACAALAEVRDGIAVEVLIDGRPWSETAGHTALSRALGGRARSGAAAARWKVRLNAVSTPARAHPSAASVDLRCELSVIDTWHGQRVAGTQVLERGFADDVDQARAEGLRRCWKRVVTWAGDLPPLSTGKD